MLVLVLDDCNMLVLVLDVSDMLVLVLDDCNMLELVMVLYWDKMLASSLVFELDYKMTFP